MSDCIDRGYRNVRDDGKGAVDFLNHMRDRLKFEGRSHGRTKKVEGDVSIVSTKRSDLPRVSRSGEKRSVKVSSCSNSPVSVYSDDPDFTPSLAKHLQDTQPADSFQRRSSVPDIREQVPKKLLIPSSSDEEAGGLAGWIRLARREMSRKTSKAAKTRLPRFYKIPNYGLLFPM